MGERRRRHPFGRLALAGIWASVLVLLAAGPAVAADVGATPAAPSISGRVSGATTAGGRLTLEADALQAGGWQGLDTIEVELLVNGKVADRLSFDITNNILTVNTQDLVVGTGAKASGTYLQMSGAGVVVTTGGAHLMLRLNATIVRAIPTTARFRMTALDDFGASASVLRSVAKPKSSGGFSWGEVATFVAVALFAGGFIGNVFASHRRAPVRPSVYSSIQRRIDEERDRQRATP